MESNFESAPFLEAINIGFRQLESIDLGKIRDWRNQPGIRSRTREFAPLNMLNQKKWWESLRNRENIMFGVYKQNDVNRSLIGVCGLTHIDWKNRNAEFAYYLGGVSERGKGYGREVAYLLFHYGFDELGLHRIWAEVYENAQDILKVDRKLGFQTEGIKRESCFWDGQWWNSHILSVLSNEWLEMKDGYLNKVCKM